MSIDKEQLQIINNYAKRPGIDPFLLMLIRHAEKGKVENLVIWLDVSGTIYSGTVVRADEQVKTFARHFDGMNADTSNDPDLPDSKAVSPEESSHMERIVTLLDVLATSGEAHIHVSFARVKLSQVGAWGFGRLVKSTE